ncbi:hypothetical protein [Actinocrispum wychmicini]|uniref:Uncharacterized protein n=1 Tax=Actinocrispum wychmicini TaxID=1213861 RepID=A0A4R2JKF8_9PSEU|nr:hypothetical protein [Actinocrispum wychmicini]TCO59297.1 hypothetical protein EV192_104138 [Actinocrispum wychmicini]
MNGLRWWGVWLTVQGAGSVNELVAALAEIPGVLSVSGDDANSLAA